MEKDGRTRAEVEEVDTLETVDLAVVVGKVAEVCEVGVVGIVTGEVVGVETEVIRVVTCATVGTEVVVETAKVWIDEEMVVVDFVVVVDGGCKSLK